MNQNQPKKPYTNDLMRYAGLGAQLFAALGAAVFIGYKADRWLQTRFPLLVWLAPLLVLATLLYKLIRDTNKRE